LVNTVISFSSYLTISQFAVFVKGFFQKQILDCILIANLAFLLAFWHKIHFFEIISSNFESQSILLA